MLFTGPASGSGLRWPGRVARARHAAATAAARALTARRCVPRLAIPLRIFAGALAVLAFLSAAAFPALVTGRLIPAWFTHSTFCLLTGLITRSAAAAAFNAPAGRALSLGLRVP